MTLVRRDVRCPELKDEVHYRLVNVSTGEIRECSLLAPLLRILAAELDGKDGIASSDMYRIYTFDEDDIRPEPQVTLHRMVREIHEKICHGN